MMTAEGRKSPVHVHVDRETPVHVHLKKKKKGKPGVPTAVEVCSNSLFFRIPKKIHVKTFARVQQIGLLANVFQALQNN